MELEIKDYNKEIKGKVILQDINLKFKSGKVYGFFGRNGSGKTMLFRAIATLIYPTSGNIYLNEESILEKDFDLSQIGLLIEHPSFYTYLTGYQNLELLYTINNKKNPEHIKEILNKVGLQDAINKKYKEYSLGMKQRLRIAQCIMENQKIIILDEPTNGIDENGLKDIYKLIEEEKSHDKIILIASHNKEDLEILCDVIYKIENGSITGTIDGGFNNDKISTS